MNADRLQLLIADDEAAHVQAIRRAFAAADADLEIRSVGTLREYRAAVQERSPDLALLALDLPDGCAVEALAAPSEDGPFPILVMAAGGHPQTRVEALSSGALDCVVMSPEAFATMPQTVSRALREWELIQKHRRTEARLRELAAHQESILATVPDIIMAVDLRKIYTWGNRAGLAFFGDDVIGKEAAFFFEGQQQTFKAVQSLFDGDEQVVYLESWQRRQDGEKRLLAWWCHTLKDSAGRVTGALSSARDITASKQAETALQASEERYRSILNASPDGIVILDAGGIIRMASPMAVVMAGRARSEEVIGLRITDFLVPEDRERATTNLATLFHGQSVGIMEYRAVRADGSTYDAEVTAASIRDAEGRPFQMVVMVRDITARKQAETARRETEHKLQLLFDSMTSGFALHQIIRNEQGVPRDYRFLQVNPAFERLTGLSAEELIGRTVLQVLPKIEPGWIERYGKVATTGESVAFDDYSQELNRHYQVVAYRPEAEHFAVIIEDVTVRKQTEAQMATQMDELRRWQTITLGREGRIAELKREVNALAARFGQNPPYGAPDGGARKENG